MYYTYAYLREDKTPYYIGKGRNNRINEFHTKYVKLPPKERRIILKYFDNEYSAYEHEKYMIFVFGRKDLDTGVLINRTEGGDAPPKNNIAGWNKGLKMKFSEERNKKISQSLSGKKKSDEHKKKLGEAAKGRIPWNKGKSRFETEEEKINHKREYNKKRSARLRTEKKLAQGT
jgi:hypothetical protein